MKEQEHGDGIDPRQHERLCAWLFGELDGAERAAFEGELADDPALRAERDRLQRTVALVRDAGMATAELSGARREALARAIPGAGWSPRRIALAAAAAVVIGGLAAGVALWSGRSDRGDRPGAPERIAGLPMPPAEETADMAAHAARVQDRRPRRENARVDAVAGAPVPVDAAPQAAAGEGIELYGAIPERPKLGNPAAPAEEPVAFEEFHEVAVVPEVGGVATMTATTPSDSKESAFDSNQWNSAVGLGGGTGTRDPRAPTGFDVFSVGSGGGGGEVRFVLPTGPEAEVRRLFVGDPPFAAPDIRDIPADEGSLSSVVGGFLGGPDAASRVDPEAFFRACRPLPGERPRDMFFRFWGDNAFVLTRGDALATFAADVDTASYVLARRYLRDGVLPEKAQIRTEEFVNFFTPDLAPPGEGDFAIHTELAPSPFGGSEARWLLRVGLRAREVPIEQREPLALTFVVDTSGSMRTDRRLELVKHALLTLVSRLDARDRIGIVAFANDARLVLPMTSADRAAEIAAVVGALRASGSTNAEAGLLLGYELAATGLDPERQSRVVFLSDGVANVGETDQARIAERVRERRDAGILLNTIGVGMGNHADVFLEQLANQGDGICDYVDDARAVQRAIVERFTSAFQAVASDVKIQVEFDDGRVLRWRQLGYENRVVADQHFRNDAVDAGEVGSGHQVNALFELESSVTPAAPEVLGAGTWATVRVRWLPPRRVGDTAERVATEVEHRVDAASLRRAFTAASPGFRRAALVAQFAEVLRRSTHAYGDSYPELMRAIQELARSPAFAADADTAELVTLVERADALGIGVVGARSEWDVAVDEYKRHHWLRHQLVALDGEPTGADLDALREQNDRLEQRIRELLRR